MKVALIGAGKMGLPLACLIADHGADVIACDVNPELVEAINRGSCPIDEPGVSELLARSVAAGRLHATTDTAAAAAESDVIIVIVPALLTDDLHADLSIMESVTRQIATTVRPGTLVVYETTVPVGTSRKVFAPLLEGTGARVAYSPERVKSAHVLDHLTETPKVVGGADPEIAQQVADFYHTHLGAPVFNVETLEAAEFVKVAGMLYRDVNIALANQLAGYAEAVGLDLPALLEPINTDGEAHVLRPGVGVGGHCTPVYPYFIIHDADERHTPITLARQARLVNDGQPEHVVARIESVLGSLDDVTVTILGLGFRPGIKEHLYSPAFLLQPALRSRGARVVLHDPLYSDEEIRAHGFEPGPIEGATVLVLNTAHNEYSSLQFADLAGAGLRLVADGRNYWSRVDVEAAGPTYLGVGIG